MNREQSFKILVVDDEYAIFELLVRTARTSFPEASFVCAQSPQETLDYVASQPAKSLHLILLDIDLQQALNGLDLLPQLYGRYKGQVPVVMLTSSIDQRFLHESYDLGAVAYTQKPDDLQGWKDYVAALRDYLYTVSRLRYSGLH